MMRKLATVIFGVKRRRVTRVPITPEFGVRVVLHAGDKVVRRNAKGEVVVTTITHGAERWV